MQNEINALSPNVLQDAVTNDSRVVLGVGLVKVKWVRLGAAIMPAGLLLTVLVLYTVNVIEMRDIAMMATENKM